MGRFLRSAKKAREEMEGIAKAAERVRSATAGSGASGGSVTYVINSPGSGAIVDSSGRGASYGLQTISAGSGGGGGGSRQSFGSDDAQFRLWLRSRGITAKHLLENVKLMADLLAEFQRMRAGNQDYRRLGLS